jgi:hypothetical protein
MKNGFVWLREGGVNKRKVTDDPDSKTWWSVAPRAQPPVPPSHWRLCKLEHELVTTD